MTVQGCWATGRALLGIYFVVQGLLAACSILGVFGLSLPDEGGRLGLVLAASLQAAIACGAGVLLLRASSWAPALVTDVADTTALPITALQLMGVYFIVFGLSDLVSEGTSIFLYSMAWWTRAADLLGATIQTAAGAVLLARPQTIFRRLREYESA